MDFSKLRRERSKQDSGFINRKIIPILKNRHYHIIHIPLDGDAPKQYIKAYFYCSGCPRIHYPGKWRGYFAKYGGKSYPHESVVEYCINRIGEYLGLNMNKTRLVIANEQIRFLSEDFIKKGKKLIHGIEVIAEYIEDRQIVDEINQDRRDRRKYLTFELIEMAIQHVYPINADELLRELIKLITYDAIVGNNDRHYYNWGFIGDIYKNTGGQVKFAPIYDTARALLWNKKEETVRRMFEQHQRGANIDQMEAYINRPRPRISLGDNPESNHFELIEGLASYKEEYKNTVNQLINKQVEQEVLQKFDNELAGYFSTERASLMRVILEKRFHKLRSLTNA